MMIFSLAFLEAASTFQAARFSVAALGLSFNMARMLLRGFFLVLRLMVSEAFGAFKTDCTSSLWRRAWRSEFWMTADGMLQFFFEGVFSEDKESSDMSTWGQSKNVQVVDIEDFPM